VERDGRARVADMSSAITVHSMRPERRIALQVFT